MHFSTLRYEDDQSHNMLARKHWLQLKTEDPVGERVLKLHCCRDFMSKPRLAQRFLKLIVSGHVESNVAVTKS